MGCERRSRGHCRRGDVSSTSILHRYSKPGKPGDSDDSNESDASRGVQVPLRNSASTSLASIFRVSNTPMPVVATPSNSGT